MSANETRLPVSEYPYYTVLGLPITDQWSSDGAFAPETVDSGLIPRQVNQRLKTIFPASVFDVQQ